MKEVGPFSSSDYKSWRIQRLWALDNHLGAGWLRGARVLELGAGGGELSSMLIERGAESVLAVDARKEYAIAASERPRVTAAQVDLDLEDMPCGPFDIIMHLGVLYHLGDPFRSIDQALSRATRLVVLETEVIDSFSPDDRIVRQESPTKADDGVGPIGIRLSPSGIEARVRLDGWEPALVDVPDLDGSPHKYRWEVAGTMKGACESYRRMWACVPQRL